MQNINENLITITVKALDEYLPVRGNAVVTDNPKADKVVEDRILRRLEKNRWAWCSVRVRATIDGFEGDSYLGCCSYKSKEDFIENSGYYESMKEEAIAELVGRLEKAKQALNKLMTPV